MRPPLTPEQLRRLGGLKWTYHDSQPLAAWVAEMDFGIANPVAEALHDAIDRGDTAYAYPAAERAMAGAATAYWAEYLNWQVDAARVYAVPDVVEGIERAIEHLTSPGSSVVLHTPAYFPFFPMVKRAGRDIVEVRSSKDVDGLYRLDLDGIDRAFSDGAGSIVLCNPWNPTGRVLNGEELTDLVELAARHGARVIADEIHSSIIYPPNTHVAAASLDPDTVVTVTSASKAWNLPGLKSAQVVLTNDDDPGRWPEYAGAEIGSTLGLFANAAAYRAGRPWLDDVLARLESNRRLLTGLIRAHMPELGFTTPDGTYLAWLDFTAYGLADPAAFFMEEAGVALTDGAPFGSGIEGHVRFNFATFEPILIEIIEKMAAALAR